MYVRDRLGLASLMAGFHAERPDAPAGLAMVDDSGRIDGPAADGHGRIALLLPDLCAAAPSESWSIWPTGLPPAAGWSIW